MPKKQFSTTLFLEIERQLREEHGIDIRKKGLRFLTDYEFSAEELSLVKKLEFNDRGLLCLDGIELLENLETLTIKTSYNGLPNKFKPIQSSSITNDDISSIERCKNLKNLTIVNQCQISGIDLSGLTKLEELNISCNDNLERIEGINMLSELGAFTCFGNNSLRSVDGLDKAIETQGKNGKLYELNLDVMLFPQAIGYNYRNVMKYNYDASEAFNHSALEELDMLNCFWYEQSNTPIKITHGQMRALHNKACRILNDNVPRTSSVADTVVAVERYLAENVTYDMKGKENPSRQHTTEELFNLALVRGPKMGTNSTYNALVLNSCVCEGYTRGEQYLLALRNIKAFNVMCIAGEDTLNFGEKNAVAPQMIETRNSEFHSIIRIEDYYNLYSDPCWNASCYQAGDTSMPYTLLTKSEIRKSHTLSFEEKGIKTFYGVDRSRIQASIKYNTAFREATRTGVDELRDSLNADLRGAIPVCGRIPRVGGR